MGKYIVGGKVVGARELEPITMNNTTKVIYKTNSKESPIIKNEIPSSILKDHRYDLIVFERLINRMNQTGTINKNFNYAGFSKDIQELIESIIKTTTRDNIRTDKIIVYNAIHDKIMVNNGYLKVQDIEQVLNDTPFATTFLG